MSVFQFISCVEWIPPIFIEERVVSTKIGRDGGHFNGKAGLIQMCQRPDL